MGNYSSSAGKDKYNLSSAPDAEKSQPEGKRRMPETRFTEFPALSVDRGLGCLSLHQGPMIDYFFTYYNLKVVVLLPFSQ